MDGPSDHRTVRVTTKFGIFDLERRVDLAASIFNQRVDISCRRVGEHLSSDTLESYHQVN